MGHEVEIFEQRKHLGGMLRYGIPNYRLPNDLLEEEINSILSTGIKVHTNVSVGKDIEYDKLNKDFDTIYIAIGAQTGKNISVEGQDAEGLMSAVDILRDLGDHIHPDFTGKKVAVIGGGNVAIDAARTAVRLNAESVSIVYRRRKVDMPAMDHEIEGAIAEGCAIYDLNTPVRIEADENNKVKGLWVQPQVPGPIQGDRPKPLAADKDEVKIDCDIVISAIGQNIETEVFEKEGIPTTWGQIDTLNSGQIQDKPNIYAGGDCVSGPDTVIKAIAAGKVAAANIDEYLEYNHTIKANVDIPGPNLEDKEACGRVNMLERQVDERLEDFDLVEIGMTCQEASQESKRCLRCDHFGFGSLRGGRNKQW